MIIRYMEQFQPLIDILKVKHGWVAAIPVWMSFLTVFCRFAVKPFNERMQAAMTNALASAKNDPDEAAWWSRRVLATFWYRVICFLADALTSVKFPTNGDFKATLQVKPPA